MGLIEENYWDFLLGVVDPRLLLWILLVLRRRVLFALYYWLKLPVFE